ncbi:MAG TPA: GNAT family N-acetyltransferase [Nocardioidaceae bacterium]|nr:GNAT family N-acetyltransferase [Nocardioidaceae bacterium]
MDLTSRNETITIDTAGPEDFEALGRVLQIAFPGPPAPPEEVELERDLVEFERTLAARAGSEVVGSATAYSFSMTVPGGRQVPTAGVSWVGVLPTHRRRGIARALMRRQLDDIARAGREPLAALWASESSIYGRFGYGPASHSLSIRVARDRGVLREVEGADRMHVRFVDNEESVELLRPVYDAAARRRAGMILPPTDAWYRARVVDPEARRKGASPLQTAVVFEQQDRPCGYVRYATKSEWGRAGAAGSVRVREMEWNVPAAAAALWRYLLDLDLVRTLHAPNRPVDDPLLHLLVDPRAAQPEVDDALYVRLVDLPAAMQAREYAVPVDVVLEVTDDFLPHNTGRWRLTAAGDEATCVRSDQPADITLTARDLAATYLGGSSLAALAGAGLVAEHTPGSVASLSRALLAEPAPFCPFVF